MFGLRQWKPFKIAKIPKVNLKLVQRLILVNSKNGTNTTNDVIKKGKTAKGIITYELENDKQVTKATKGTEGKNLAVRK